MAACIEGAIASLRGSGDCRAMMFRFAPPIACLLLLGAAAPEERYAASCHTPLPGWQRPGFGWHHVDLNHLRIRGDGSLRWNRAAISRETLDDYLARIKVMEPQPVVILEVDPKAGCAMVRRIRGQMDDVLGCAENGLCGEGIGRWNGGMIYRLAGDDPEAAKLLEELEEAADAAAAPKDGR
ncbi:ExbD/TolR family protein [Sphingomonas colocasiae]|uniref:Uncharacterized protein n=1 Tax=Sphingomonas colocasiae TaxID=1848973 RepID=A0ABS7PV38_9SPHN|nr:hypothetical protein [Sphingomonas colocasiae]MBY8825016.1 hypothetical protein [Sphingomonas colocasiae]